MPGEDAVLNLRCEGQPTFRNGYGRISPQTQERGRRPQKGRRVLFNPLERICRPSRDGAPSSRVTQLIVASVRRVLAETEGPIPVGLARRPLFATQKEGEPGRATREVH